MAMLYTKNMFSSITQFIEANRPIVGIPVNPGQTKNPPSVRVPDDVATDLGLEDPHLIVREQKMVDVFTGWEVNSNFIGESTVAANKAQIQATRGPAPVGRVPVSLWKRQAGNLLYKNLYWISGQHFDLADAHSTMVGWLSPQNLVGLGKTGQDYKDAENVFVEFDLLSDFGMDLNSIISEHPIQTGASFADHISNQLERGHLTGLVTNFRTGIQSQKRYLPLDAWMYLHQMWEAREIVSLLTPFGLYEDVAIENINTTMTNDEGGDSLSINISFVRVKQVELMEAKVDATVTAPVKKGGTKKATPNNNQSTLYWGRDPATGTSQGAYLNTREDATGSRVGNALATVGTSTRAMGTTEVSKNESWWISLEYVLNGGAPSDIASEIRQEIQKIKSNIKNGLWYLNPTGDGYVDRNGAPVKLPIDFRTNRDTGEAFLRIFKGGDSSSPVVNQSYNYTTINDGTRVATGVAQNYYAFSSLILKNQVTGKTYKQWAVQKSTYIQSTKDFNKSPKFINSSTTTARE
jgi:hypothetical protein